MHSICLIRKSEASRCWTFWVGRWAKTKSRQKGENSNGRAYHLWPSSHYEPDTFFHPHATLTTTSDLVIATPPQFRVSEIIACVLDRRCLQGFTKSTCCCVLQDRNTSTRSNSGRSIAVAQRHSIQLAGPCHLSTPSIKTRIA